MRSPHTCRGHVSVGLAAPGVQISVHSTSPPQGFGVGRAGEAATPHPRRAGTAQAPAPALCGSLGMAGCRTGGLGCGSARFVFI